MEETCFACFSFSGRSLSQFSAPPKKSLSATELAKFIIPPSLSTPTKTLLSASSTKTTTLVPPIQKILSSSYAAVNRFGLREGRTSPRPHGDVFFRRRHRALSRTAQIGSSNG